MVRKKVEIVLKGKREDVERVEKALIDFTNLEEVVIFSVKEIG